MERARLDRNFFAEYCFDIEQQPLHIDFHARAAANPLLVLWSPPEHAKTFQFGFIGQLHDLGNDPNLHMAHVSSTADIPEANLEQIVQHINRNAKVQEVFPWLKVKKFKRTRSGVLGLWVEREFGAIDRDASIYALGMQQTIMGRRLHRLLFDDIHDFDNTYTPEQTQKMVKRVQLELLGRMMANSRAVYIGHPWRKEDTGHFLIDKGWAFHRYDAECGVNGTPGPPGLWPKIVHDPKTGQPFGWSWERLMARKGKVDPVFWELQWRCRLPSASEALFPWAALVACLRAFPMAEASRDYVVSGVDLATGVGRDRTVITTGYAHAGRKRVLDIRSGFWDEARLFSEFRALLRAYPNHVGFLVEDNGMQKVLLGITQRPEIMRAYGWRQEDLERFRCEGYTTGREKMDPRIGIRALSVDVKAGTLELPADPELRPWADTEALMRGLDGFDPDKPEKHTADHVMSFWLCCTMMRRAGMLASERHLGIS